MITTNKSTFDHLYDINRRLPDLNITRVEYAIDLYCKTPEAVADLFYLIRRYIYRRNTKRTSKEGGKFYGWQDCLNGFRERNAVYYIWTGKKSGKHIKVYERGPDSKRIKGKWHHKDVDRVRIEFKLKGKPFPQYGLSTLERLLRNQNLPTLLLTTFSLKTSSSPQICLKIGKIIFPKTSRETRKVSCRRYYLPRMTKNLENITQYIEDNQRMQALKSRYH